MSDLIKAQNMPQFNWYTRWTSLGADGMPDKLIKEGLKQLELYPDLVFWFGIGWYFPGIFPTDTKGKLGWDISVLYIWWEPLFSLKERLLPPF
jgi:hypothetical protein